MDQNFDELKLILEERRRELITQNNMYSQLNGSGDSRMKSWTTGQLREFLDNLRISSVIDWLFPEPKRTTQTGFELNECQATPECQSC